MKSLKNFLYLFIILIFVAIAGSIGRHCAKDYVDIQKENKARKIKPENVDTTNRHISSESTREDIQKKIQAFLKKSLLKLPYRVDGGTECYKVDLEYKHVIYFYRLFNTAKQDFDAHWAKNKMQNQIIDYFCQSPRLKYFRNEEITMTYQYVDKNFNCQMTT